MKADKHRPEAEQRSEAPRAGRTSVRLAEPVSGPVGDDQADTLAPPRQLPEAALAA
ncbi:hypothetical protein Kpho01_32330 [Kitasatospora phosalacinea]|uniref:Uncharacterized protein n=1 Tax=Kitasatospora phosalacinea TaxID=2065 RepID=A0A9W6PI16_9ACTN|nr:hypothetical protein Kpho01_32330 [Kitasatospora phosalacinea]